jgi:hypothetical protein
LRELQCRLLLRFVISFSCGEVVVLLSTIPFIGRLVRSEYLEVGAPSNLFCPQFWNCAGLYDLLSIELLASNIFWIALAAASSTEKPVESVPWMILYLLCLSTAVLL